MLLFQFSACGYIRLIQLVNFQYQSGNWCNVFVEQPDPGYSKSCMDNILLYYAWVCARAFAGVHMYMYGI